MISKCTGTAQSPTATDYTIANLTDYGTASLTSFPYCKCNEYRCAASPYTLSLTSQKNITATSVEFCFTIQYVGCSIPSSCCSQEVNDVGKIEFSSGKACVEKAVKVLLG
jgi:hypothetical protein